LIIVQFFASRRGMANQHAVNHVKNGHDHDRVQGRTLGTFEHHVCRLLKQAAELTRNMIGGRSINGQQRGFPARR